MAEPQLSVRSARARDLAHMLAKRERRTVAHVVEQALEDYAREKIGNDQNWSTFIEQLKALPREPDEIDFDFDSHIREGRKPHKGIDLE